MLNDRLDFLIRKNKGEAIFKSYKNAFKLSGFHEEDLEYIDLERSDNIRESIKEVFAPLIPEDEMLTDTATFKESQLLMGIYKRNKPSDKCYVFCDEVDLCGMFLTKSNLAIEYAFNTARLSLQNTFFILDKQGGFSIRINYYDRDNTDFKGMYDIQRMLIR